MLDVFASKTLIGRCYARVGMNQELVVTGRNTRNMEKQYTAHWLRE